jgi:hypothetical protein
MLLFGRRGFADFSVWQMLINLEDYQLLTISTRSSHRHLAYWFGTLRLTGANRQQSQSKPGTYTNV